MRNTQQVRSESGYAMAALLVAMALMALFMTIAMPVWKQAGQREKEAELIWRGQQYDRALQLFRRKTTAPGAPNLDLLVQQKYLRRKYKDPITGGDFALKPVAPGGINLPPGVPQPGSSPNGTTPSGSSSNGMTPGGTTTTGTTPGGTTPNGQLIGGVRSTSKAKSIRILNGRDHYDQWEFVYMPYGTKTTNAGPAASPGGLPGQNPAGRSMGGGPGQGTTPQPSSTPPPGPAPTPRPEPGPTPEPSPEPSETPPPDPQ